MNEKATATVKAADIKKASSLSKRQRKERSEVCHSPSDQILSLQRTIGNQGVRRLFASGLFQAKLTIGPPNDIYEQEADRVAGEVMRMPEPGIQMKPG